MSLPRYDERIDRESAPCTVCGATPGEACEFSSGPAPMVDDGGVKRRAVHGARYAETLSPEDRRVFWERAVEDWLSAELARMDEAEKAAIRDVPPSAGGNTNI